MNFKTTKKNTPNELKILLFGTSGSGKTYSIKSLPCKDSEVLIISTERGSEVLRDRNFILFDDCADNPLDLKNLFVYLKKENKFKWLVWDSISDWSEKMYNHIKNNLSEKDKINKFTIWGKLKDSILTANQYFLSIPNCSKITIAQAKEDDNGGLKFLMSGSAKDSLGFFYDEIYAIKVMKEDDKILRKFVTNNDGTFECKSRMAGGGNPLDLYEPADFKHIIDKCYKNKTNI